MLGQKLREIIKEKDIKQVELAKSVGISPSRLSNYLSDKREPDYALLEKMARYLGVDLNYFASKPFKKSVSDKTTELPIDRVQGCVEVPVYQFKGKKIAEHTKTILLDEAIAGDDCKAFIIGPNDYGSILNKGGYIITAPVTRTSLKTGDAVLMEGRNGDIYKYLTDNKFINTEFNKIVELEDTEDLLLITQIIGVY